MNTRPLTLVAALALLGAAGCAPNRQSVEPYAICAMPDDCKFSGSCSAYALGAIGYNPSGGTDWLQFGVELRNQLPNNADTNVGRLNNNDAHVTSLRLEVSGPVSGTISQDVGHQTVPASGTAVVWTYVLPYSTIATLLNGTYTVDVIYVGYYDNGREFETGPFPIAVEVDDTLAFACATGALSCGTLQQSLFACK